MFSVLIPQTAGSDHNSNAEYFAGIDRWAQENCRSYIGYLVQDVNYSSPELDEVANYEFRDAIDANWFKLRWV